MSKETIQWLNENTLIGFTEKRGNAWHFDPEYHDTLTNHYPGAVPVGDVQRRLFSWEPVSVPVYINYQNSGHTMIEGKQAIVRSDNRAVMGIFSDGYVAHSYKEWLLGVTSNLIGDTLTIGSAGLLRSGAQAWVSIEVPENIRTPEGVEFRPNLLAVTSLDGSLATTYKRVITNVVCDNTMAAGLSERGQVFKLKHTRNSGLRIEEARDALALVETTADAFADEVKTLCEISVSKIQWQRFLEEYVPMPSGCIVSRGVTLAERRRDQLHELWGSSPMVEPWKGTAYGVVQAVNTHTHHLQTVRGKDRAQRNWEMTVKGQFDDLDTSTLKTLEKVLASV